MNGVKLNSPIRLHGMVLIKYTDNFTSIFRRIICTDRWTNRSVTMFEWGTIDIAHKFTLSDSCICDLCCWSSP
jgi:hypothetical protein